MKLKRLLSFGLAVLMLCSIVAIAVEAKDVNSKKTGNGRPNVSDIVNSDPDNQVETKTYMFYMPEKWRNEQNCAYNGASLDSCVPGIYWWAGDYVCEDYKGENADQWPGYSVTENVDGNKNIFKAVIPASVHNLIWNNLVETSVDNPEKYNYSYQSVNVVCDCYYEEDDDYGFYPDGIDSFDGMIYVIDPEGEKEYPNGNKLCGGDWFYYYGGGEYGIYPTRDEAILKDKVYSNGEFPKIGNDPEETTEAPEPATNSVQFFNTQKWDNVYLYAWNSDSAEENAEWPGELLTVREQRAEGDIYNAVIDSKYDTFVFSNGTAKEMTVEIKFNPEVTGYYPKERDSRGKWEVGTYPEITNPTEPEPTEAVNPGDTKIYFDSGYWTNEESVFCHIWERGSDSFFPWHSKKEKCTYENGKWAYDINALKDSVSFDNGLEPGKDYCVIFSDETGKQTYECTFGLACLGDTLKVIEGEKVENPVDDQKSSDKAVWEKNADAYGPHLALTSIGNIVGEFLCPNETATELIGDWLPVYYKSQFSNPVETLAKAYLKFEIKTIDGIKGIYNYIIAKKTGEDEKAMLKIIEDAFKLAFNNNPTEPTQNIPTNPVVNPTSPVINPTTPKINPPKKYPNPIKIKAKTKKIKMSKLKKGKVTVKPLTITKNQGKVTVAKIKKGTNSKIYKKIKVNKKTGAITFKKGKYAKKTYKIKLQIKAAGNTNYSAKSVTKVVKVKII